jgi:hypothetical protein
MVESLSKLIVMERKMMITKNSANLSMSLLKEVALWVFALFH